MLVYDVVMCMRCSQPLCACPLLGVLLLLYTTPLAGTITGEFSDVRSVFIVSVDDTTDMIAGK